MCIFIDLYFCYCTCTHVSSLGCVQTIINKLSSYILFYFFNIYLFQLHGVSTVYFRGIACVVAELNAALCVVTRARK